MRTFDETNLNLLKTDSDSAEMNMTFKICSFKIFYIFLTHVYVFLYLTSILITSRIKICLNRMHGLCLDMIFIV